MSIGFWSRTASACPARGNPSSVQAALGRNSLVQLPCGLLIVHHQYRHATHPEWQSEPQAMNLKLEYLCMILTHLI